MAIATIPATVPFVEPASPEITYDALDLRKLVITERKGNYRVRGIYLPYNKDADKRVDEKHHSALKFDIHDFGVVLGDFPDLRTAAKAFVKELAAAVEVLNSQEPEPQEPII